jgi:hypothetical protein
VATFSCIVEKLENAGFFILSETYAIQSETSVHVVVHFESDCTGIFIHQSLVG